MLKECTHILYSCVQSPACLKHEIILFLTWEGPGLLFEVLWHCFEVELVWKTVSILMTVRTYPALDCTGLLLQRAPGVSCQERTESDILASLAQSDLPASSYPTDFNRLERVKGLKLDKSIYDPNWAFCRPSKCECNVLVQKYSYFPNSIWFQTPRKFFSSVENT